MESFNPNLLLTEDEKTLIENKSIYSSDFAKVLHTIETKYNLTWNIKTKEYEQR